MYRILNVEIDSFINMVAIQLTNAIFPFVYNSYYFKSTINFASIAIFDEISTNYIVFKA